jgi:hypothetical protein
MDADMLANELKGAGVEGITSSYAYIVDKDGTMLYHPTADKIGKPVENSVVKGLVREVQWRIPYMNGIKEQEWQKKNSIKKTVLYFLAD